MNRRKTKKFIKRMKRLPIEKLSQTEMMLFRFDEIDIEFGIKPEKIKDGKVIINLNN